MINIIILGDKYHKGKKSKGCPGLIKYNKTNILENQLFNINKILSPNTVYYVSGFDNTKLETYINKYKGEPDHGVNLVYNHEYEKYNESYSLGIALEKCDLKHPVLILSGYFIPTLNLLKTINGDKSLIFIDKNKKNKLGCIIENNIIENIFFDLNNYIQDIYFITANDSMSIKKLLNTKKYNNAFIFELINQAISIGSMFYPSYSINNKQDKIYVKKKNSYI